MVRCGNRSRLGWLVAMGLVVFSIDRAEAQFRKGFTQQTTDVTLKRKRPPKVYLMATDIAVKATAQTRETQALAERLATSLQAELISGDSRLKPSAEPGTIISCGIGRSEVTTDWGSRRVTVRRRTGEKQVLDSKTGKYRTEDVYTNVEETQRFQTVTGQINITYQAADKSGAVLDSDSLSGSYKAEFINGDGAPTAGAVEQILLQRIVSQIVPRLVPTFEGVKVMLGRPNDQVDDVNKLAEAGLWQQALQRLETMKPIQDKNKEPYRVFNIGVANEALAYQAPDVASAKTFLEQAALKYAAALEMKPDEKYFRDPQMRIDTSIAAYKTLEQQQAAYDQIVRTAQENAAKALTAKQEAAARESELAAAKTSGGRSLDGKTDPDTLTNADVIDLAKGGLDQQNMVATINGAKLVQFDLSPAGLKQLLSNGVTNQLIVVMRTKQQLTTAKKPAAAPATAAKPASAPAAVPAKPVTPPVKKPGGGTSAQR